MGIQDSPSLFEAAQGAPVDDPTRPLADRLRPQRLEEVVGQDHLLAPDAPLGRMIATGRLPSIILWGPPGCGKTTIARLLAQRTGLGFESVSATFSGVAELRKVFATAARQREIGQGTLLFVDEIHRFNRAQQDSFLPYVEDGTVVLVGATTENPSFELNGALLSRCQVMVLRRLDQAALSELMDRAEALIGRRLPLTEAARSQLVAMADGDGRYLLGMVEQVLSHARGQMARPAPPGTGDAGAGEGAGTGDAGTGGTAGPEGAGPGDAGTGPADRGDPGPGAPSDPGLIDAGDLAAVVASRAPWYDKSGEEHYNLISALHKSIRGSDPQAALYWLARMLEGGEDPLYVARRLVHLASEDIGMADPGALQIALAAWEAYERLGSPEGELAIAQAVIHLATAPKSVAVYRGLTRARAAARATGSLAPPAHILNAPTRLMKELGYGQGYQYDPDTADGFSGADYFPPGYPREQRERFYEPTGNGHERRIAERLAHWDSLRRSHEHDTPGP